MVYILIPTERTDINLMSSSSLSSYDQKVDSWLGFNQKRHGVPEGRGEYNVDSKYVSSLVEYPPIANKVQALLFYGEYSLFRKWVVLVEGDFVQVRFNELGKREPFASPRAPIKKKCSLGDIRTLALTKNWLLICYLLRTYQDDKDGLIPAGIVLYLRRLVPLKFIRLAPSSPRQRIISIKNQSGLTKEYQLLERPGMDENEQYLAWKVAIKNMDPKHDDNTLLTTLKLHERWSREYLCRLLDWQRRTTEKRPTSGNLSIKRKSSLSKAPSKTLPSLNKVRSSATSSLKSEGTAANFKKENSFAALSPKESKKARKEESKRLKQKRKEEKRESRRKKTEEKRESRRKKKELKKERKRVKRESKKAKEKEKADQKNANTYLTKSISNEEVTYTSPIPTGITGTEEDSEYSTEFFPGEEVTVGPDAPMTLSQDSDPEVGIETSVGPSRSISPDSENDQKPGQPTEDKRPKRSVRDVFRMGLFLSKKNKKKKALDPATGISQEPHTSLANSRPRELQRRVSRLEMGIPIEEVFAGIQFATIEKKTTTPQSSDAGDDVITEQPYVFDSENQSGSTHNDVINARLDANLYHRDNASHCLGLEGISEDLT